MKETILDGDDKLTRAQIATINRRQQNQLVFNGFQNS